MDKLKGMLNKAGGSSSGSQQPAQGGDANKEDYLDKGVDAAEKKFGMNVSRENNEKATDFARNQFEKTTGKNVPDKFSN